MEHLAQNEFVQTLAIGGLVLILTILGFRLAGIAAHFLAPPSGTLDTDGEEDSE